MHLGIILSLFNIQWATRIKWYEFLNFVLFFLSFLYSFPLPAHCLPILWHIHKHSLVICFFLTCVSHKNSLRDLPISAPMLFASRTIASAAIIFLQRFLYCRVVNILQSDLPCTILHAEKDSFTPRVPVRFRECHRFADSDRSCCPRQPKFHYLSWQTRDILGLKLQFRLAINIKYTFRNC